MPQNTERSLLDPGPDPDPESKGTLLEASTTAVDEALDATQNELIAEKDARREERFIWFAVVVILFDALVFMQMGNWAAPLVIGLLEFVILIVVGRKWSVDQIWTLTEMIINKWNGGVR